jgi:hypothetical protein
MNKNLTFTGIFRNLTVAQVANVLSVVVAFIAAIVGFVSYFYKAQTVDIGGLKLTIDQAQTQRSLNSEVEGMRKQLKSVQDELQKVTALPPEAKLAVQLGQMQNTTTDLTSRLDKLERAILTSPAKALEIPLLQRDVENLRSTQQANLLAVKEGVDRLYDINKWLLGAMAISIITLALSNFLKGKDAPSEKK